MTDVKVLMPHGVKQAYRHVVALIPFGLRYGYTKVYNETTRLLQTSQYWSPQEHADYQFMQLVKLLRHCEQRVPYYRNLFSKIDFSSSMLRSIEDLASLPFMDKETVRLNSSAMIAEGYPNRRKKRESTGGTEGTPLVFHSLLGYSDQRELAFWHEMLSRVGYDLSMWLAVLRNAALPAKRLFDVNPMRRRLVLDPFKMNSSNIHQYLCAIRSSPARILHTYPSAVCLFLHFAKKRNIDLSNLFDVIFATSENVYPGQREFVEESLGARFFSFYGHSEKLVMAGECECSTDYHVQTEYGILELIDFDGNLIKEPGVVGEIVGTGFNNPLMPLVRYRTGDFAEWAPSSVCECGRQYPRIRNVVGRWLQEMVYGRSGTQISMTSLNMHSDILNNVSKYQFEQFEIGKLILKVVPSERYGRADNQNIISALQKKLGGELDLVIKQVGDIPLTSRGKHRLLLQHISL